jgi:hypothetical protein
VISPEGRAQYEGLDHLPSAAYYWSTSTLLQNTLILRDIPISQGTLERSLQWDSGIPISQVTLERSLQWDSGIPISQGTLERSLQ